MRPRTMRSWPRARRCGCRRPRPAAARASGSPVMPCSGASTSSCERMCSFMEGGSRIDLPAASLDDEAREMDAPDRVVHAGVGLAALPSAPEAPRRPFRIDLDAHRAHGLAHDLSAAGPPCRSRSSNSDDCLWGGIIRDRVADRRHVQLHLLGELGVLHLERQPDLRVAIAVAVGGLTTNGSRARRSAGRRGPPCRRHAPPPRRPRRLPRPPRQQRFFSTNTAAPPPSTTSSRTAATMMMISFFLPLAGAGDSPAAAVWVGAAAGTT